MQVRHPERTVQNFPFYPKSVGTVFNMTLQDVIDYGYDLGLQDYPIWDADEREGLNSLIVDHFRYREIGAETPRLFIYFLNRTMCEEMPALNVIFSSLATLSTAADLLNNEEILETYEGESASESESERNGTDSRTGTSSSTTTGENESETSGTSSRTTGGTNTTTSTTDVESTGSNHAYSSTNPTTTMVGKSQVDYYNSGTWQDTSADNTTENTTTSTTSGTESGSSGETVEGSSTATTTGSTSDSGTVHETGSTSDSGSSSYSRHRKGHYGRTLTGAMREYMDNDFSNILALLFSKLEPCFSPLLSDHFNGF